MSTPLVSVVVIGYRRPQLLKRTVESLLAVTSYRPLELVLSDDASPREMRETMQRLPFDRFLFSDRQRGLGHNQNKGIAAAKGDFILHLQDDWLCIGPSDFIEVALEVFAEHPDVSLVRYRAPDDPIPHDRYVTRSGRTVQVFEPSVHERCGSFAYTDNPHLKRSSFHQELGWFKEGVPMTLMELDFCQRVDQQDAVRVAYVEGYHGFVHLGESESFNPSVRRDRLRRRLLANPYTRLPTRCYLAIRSRMRQRA